MKSHLKAKAISLRNKGLSYREILTEVPVAKSTLSLWLRSVGLSKRQLQRLSERKRQAALKGAARRREQRLLSVQEAKTEAVKRLRSINKRDLWLIGTALYWAEGSKSKVHNISQGVTFSNSDPLMIRLFLKWLGLCLDVEDEDLQFEIYLHESRVSKIKVVQGYWAKTTGFSLSKFDKIYLKREKVSTNRKNTEEGYFGQLRVRVRKSTYLNRRVSACVEAICIRCGVV